MVNKLHLEPLPREELRSASGSPCPDTGGGQGVGEDLPTEAEDEARRELDLHLADVLDRPPTVCLEQGLDGIQRGRGGPFESPDMLAPLVLHRERQAVVHPLDRYEVAFVGS